MKQKVQFLMARKLILPILGIGFVVTCFSQEAITATGNNAAGSGGSVNSTTGQIAYTCINGSGGTMNQGVQLPFEIIVVTQIREAEKILLECFVSPNPASDMLRLTIDGIRNENLSYQLLDMNGKLIYSKSIEGREIEIDMQNLVSAIYFIKVIGNRQEVKTFKIIKN